MGWSCVAIGLFHVLAGNAAIPGEAQAGPTVDSLTRFLGAIFAGYGLAWLLVARQRPVPAAGVRVLAGIFLLGGLSRLLSAATQGWPNAFQIVLTVIELALPPVYFWLAAADERARPAAGSAQ
jgi:hypothetical protein